MLNEKFNNVSEDQIQHGEDITAYESANDGKPLPTIIETEFDLNEAIRKFYRKDRTYSKILEKPKAHERFGIKNGLIFTKNNLLWDVICISRKAIHNGR